MSYTPPFVTETDEPAPWLDCVWASGLMLANKASLGAVPESEAEREALRRDSGDLRGGSSWTDLVNGLRARYGWSGAAFGGSWPTFLMALGPRSGAVLFGVYGRLPSSYTRWDRAFAAQTKVGHAVYVERRGAGLWWMDPLGRGGYIGETISFAAAEAYALGFGTIRAVIAREGDLVEGMTIIELTRFPAPRAFRVGAGKVAHGYDPRRGQVVKMYRAPAHRGSTAHTDARAHITQEPKRVPNGTFVRVIDGALAGLFVPITEVELAAEVTDTPLELARQLVAALEG